MITKQFDETALLKLKQDCGSSYAKKIQKQLFATSGKAYSLSHIYKGLSVKYASENVIVAAIEVADSRRKKMEKLQEAANVRILNR